MTTTKETIPFHHFTAPLSYSVYVDQIHLFTLDTCCSYTLTAYSNCSANSSWEKTHTQRGPSNITVSRSYHWTESADICTAFCCQDTCLHSQASLSATNIHHGSVLNMHSVVLLSNLLTQDKKYYTQYYIQYFIYIYRQTKMVITFKHN